MISLLKSKINNEYFKYFQDALSLLTKNQKHSIIKNIVAQLVINLLDILGLFLVATLIFLSNGQNTNNNSGNFFQAFINKANLSQLSRDGVIFTLALISVSIFTTKTFLNIITSRNLLSFLAETATSVSENVLQQNVILENSKIKKTFTSEVVFSLSMGIPKILFYILASSILIISDIALLLLTIVSLFFYDSFTTLLAMVIFILAFWIFHQFTSKKTFMLGELATANDLAANDLILNYLRNRKEIYVKGNSRIILNMYTNRRRKHLNAMSSLIFLQNSSRYLMEIVLPISAFLLICAQFLFQNFSQGPQSLVIFLVAGARIAPALIKIQSNLIVIKSVSGEVNKVYDMTKDVHEVEKNYYCVDKETNNTTFSPTLILNNLTFSYEKNADFQIRHVSVNIEKGEVVAITGASGSGKSTLIDLSLGILEPNSGEIKLSGENPRLAVTKNPGKIAYVPQDTMIIGGSIRDNLMLGSSHMVQDDEILWNALADANLFEYVKSLDQGLDTPVGEFGVALSGGQRQRLGIARALISNPDFLIFDEITSALDELAENQIKNLIAKLKGEKTIIIVSHSPNLVQIADKIMTLANGKVIAQKSV